MPENSEEKVDSVTGLIDQILEIITFVVPLVKMLIKGGENDASGRIIRVLSADPGLAQMRAEWDDRLDKKFGKDG